MMDNDHKGTRKAAIRMRSEYKADGLAEWYGVRLSVYIYIQTHD